MAEIQTIVMPKWGLAMQEGMVAAWHVNPGDTIAKGQEIMDIETSKIANVFESLASGKLRRRLVEAGETVPAGAEQRTTYALDLPGHGGSSKDVGEATVPSLAATVLGFMDAKGIGRAHLVGHSMGGAVALELALSHPDRVASATLVCPAGLGPDISMDYINGFIEANRRKKMEPVLQMLVHDPGMVTGDMVEDVLKYKRLDGVDAALK